MTFYCLFSLLLGHYGPISHSPSSSTSSIQEPSFFFVFCLFWYHDLFKNIFLLYIFRWFHHCEKFITKYNRNTSFDITIFNFSFCLCVDIPLNWWINFLSFYWLFFFVDYKFVVVDFSFNLISSLSSFLKKLEQIFRQFSPISSITLPRDLTSGYSRCFAIISFPTIEYCQHVVC